MNKIYNNIEYYITCSRGLEEVTAKDIMPYCNKITRLDDGGVAFIGDKKALYNVNLYSRTGMYVLKKLDNFKSHSLDDLYKKVKNYSWSKLVKKTSTIAVRVKSDSEIFTNPNFCTLRVKDAIVDSIKDQKNFRPYIDRKNPDYSIFVFIKDKDVQVFLNSSGSPLFMRGYRTKIHKASLNESLAAGLILLSGWDKETPFYDPMCGSGTIPIEAALKLTKQAYPFRGITLEEFFDVLDILEEQNLIIFNKEKTEYKKNNAFFATKYHFQNLSTIPDILKFKVIDTIENKFIGTLDQRFVGDLDKDQIFVLRGSQWRVLNIDEKAFKVNVLPIRSSKEIPVPKWEGVNIPVDYKTANKVGSFRTRVRNGSVKMMNDVVSNLDFIKMPDEKTIVIESHRLPQQSVLILHSCFGTKINSTLKIILETMLDASLASKVKSSSDAYRILLSVESKFTKKHITDVFSSNFDINEIMSVALKGKNDVTWKTFCVGKKFGFYDRGDVYVKNEVRYDFERNINTPLVKEAFRELFHEKFDLEGAQKIIELIKQNEIEIEWIDVDKFSKLAEPVLDQTVMSYTNPASIDKEMLLKVRKRLMETKQRLICARCGLWQRVMTPSETHPLKCKYCKGQQITCTYEYDHELVKTIQKKHQGKKLTPDEKKNFDKAWKVSSLLSSFGKTALIVMAAYGVGPDTGARILKNRVEDDDDYLIKQIIIAEKTYTLTRGFWKD